MSDPIKAIVDECSRQAESCGYTSSALYIWAKEARFWRTIFLVAPIVCGGIAGSQIVGLIGGKDGQLVALISGLLAGFFPAIYVSLNMDMRVHEIGRSAAEFTNLRDRFRQAGNIVAQTTEPELRTAFEGLMDRMDAARIAAPPAPERCFKRAQKKFKKGDYTFDYDLAAQRT